MAEALLTVVLDRLAGLLHQQIHEDVSLVVGVQGEIRSLNNTLQVVRAVVADAEKRQMKEELVKLWLERLKDIAYRMEDVVDEWSTAILKSEIQVAETSSIPKKKVSSFISSLCVCFNQVSRRHDIALKIKDIKRQFDDVADQSSRFNFTSINYKEPYRLISISAVDISEVYGRDEDRETLVRRLLGKGCEQKMGLYVISVVGMGGIGKTTLAQLAFNHHEVKARFDERIWVCVSDPFVPIRVLRAILESVDGHSNDLHDPEALQHKIQESIDGRKFLLVLDDVWTEDYQLWEQLENCLKRGGFGSRILVTTRNESVARMMRSTYVHSLASLSLQQSQSLFGQIAYFRKSEEKIEELEEIGNKIVEKCKGLPLAIKALGSLMQSKDDKEDWENVLNSEMWELDVFETKLSAALLLSYYDLPPSLKQCFTYCAMFPKDYIIQVNDLIKLWMAQSYLNSNSGREMETIGREYFDNLAACSFFQDFEKDNKGKIVRCKMHDIVHDFAQFLCHNECFILGYGGENPKMNQLSLEKVRHAAVTVQASDGCAFLIDNLRNLHTLLIPSENGLSALASFQHLTCLRALDLRHNPSIVVVPRTVGELIHLRYLNLSECSELETLPETISELYNLQTLDVRGCWKLRKLPQGIIRLINLRHLLIGGAHFGLQSLPKGVGRLTSLRTLPFFIVSEECKIEELRNMKELRGQLEIRGLRGVEDPGEAEIAELRNKKHLHHLILEFSLRKQIGGEGMRMRMRLEDKDVTEALQPHPSLESLSIVRYNSIEWPSWIMSSSLTRLTYLELLGCRQCRFLPPLGQLPLLKSLEVSLMDSVTYVGSEFLGPFSAIAFPKLEKLYFATMRGWEKWEGEKGRIVMPCLLSMTFYSCPNLVALPNFLLQRTPLLKLTIMNCPLLELKQIGERDSRPAGVDMN